MAEGEAFAYLETTEIPETTYGLILAASIAGRLGAWDIETECREVVSGLLDDINNVAVLVAGLADGAIIGKIIESRRSSRPATGMMESHIRSEAGPLGLVRVALMDELSRIVNPRGDYGPFWPALEYGTGTAENPTAQEGRVLLGHFDPSGDAPDRDQRGLGVGSDAAFLQGVAPKGLGTITTELPARNFLRDGRDEAFVAYKEAVDAVLAKWNLRMEAILRRAQEMVARRGIEYIIDF